MKPTKVYCETGALTKGVRGLCRELNVALVHFPYDPASHTPKFHEVAPPSRAEIRDLNLAIAELPGPISDYFPSEHFGEILQILGQQHRRDALHVDSAVKSACSAFVTQDTDILRQREQLETLLGIRFFSDSELNELEQFLSRKVGYGRIND
jgi:hypothetical protein